MKRDKLILNPKSPKGEDGYRTFSVRIKEQTVAKLGRICTQTGYSRNELVGIFLEYALENCEVSKKKGS